MKHREEEVIPVSEVINVGTEVYPRLSDSRHSLVSGPHGRMLSIHDGAPNCSVEDVRGKCCNLHSYFSHLRKFLIEIFHLYQTNFAIS